MPGRLRIALIFLALAGCAQDRTSVAKPRPRVAARPSIEPALIDAEPEDSPSTVREPF